MLVPQVKSSSKHLFSDCVFCFNLSTRLASFHAASQAPCSCHSVSSSPETDPQILERWGYADEVHLGKSIRAKECCLEF